MQKEFVEFDQSAIDLKVNKYTLRCLTFTLLCTVVVWIANLCGIFIVNQRLLSGGFMIATVILLIALLVGRLVDLKKSWVKYFLLFSVTLAVTVDATTLSYHAVLLSVLPLLLATQYTSKKVIIYTYLISILGIFIGVMGSYYWGLCDANMLFLTVEQVSYYKEAATEGILRFELADYNPWYILPLYYVLPRSLLLLCLLPVIESISGNIMDYVRYAGDMKQLSERDEMTGLYNKNKYLEMMQKTYPHLQNVGVFFWDVNNLKEINDSKGHAQGDYIITIVSSMIKELTGEHCKAYRIGGDEFVMVVENPKRGEMEELLAKWEERLEQRKSFSKIEISVALGFAGGSGKNVTDVAKKADKMMYEHKLKAHSRIAESVEK